MLRSPAPAGALDSLAREAITGALFRATRALTTVAYDPSPGPEAPQSPPPPRPLLVLEGIAWGTPPQIIVEGLPGSDGPKLLQRGDTAGGVRVVRIDPSRALLAGYDTTWTLTVRTEWH